MRKRYRKNKIYFVGFMGSGKTSISKQFCKITKINWMDTDEETERHLGKKITQIFEEDGEEAFRRAETNTLKWIASKNRPIVVACGGGIVLRKQNIEIMKKSGRVVWLNASPLTIYEHVRYSKKRPLLNGHMNPEYIKSLMDKRQRFYEEAADYVIVTDGMEVIDIARKVKSDLF